MNVKVKRRKMPVPNINLRNGRKRRKILIQKMNLKNKMTLETPKKVMLVVVEVAAENVKRVVKSLLRNIVDRKAARRRAKVGKNRSTIQKIVSTKRSDIKRKRRKSVILPLKKARMIMKVIILLIVRKSPGVRSISEKIDLPPGNECVFIFTMCFVFVFMSCYCLFVL